MTMRKALLLVDFQRDFLREGGRMPVARHQIRPVLAAANRAVAVGSDWGRERAWSRLARRGVEIV